MGTQPVMGPQAWTWRAIAILFLIFLLTPMLLVIVFAFSDRALTSFPITGPSLRWWREMLDNPQFAQALTNSVTIALAVGVISSLVGTMAALGLARLPGREARIAISVLCLPLMLPPLVLAVSLLSFYAFIGLPLSRLTVIISHLLFTLPFVVLVVYARMASFDWTVVQSARDLGATPLKAFTTVILPMIRPTIVGAALVAVALSIDDFIITFFTIGTGNTLPTLVWGMIRTSLTPAVNAIGTLLILATLGSSLIALYLTRYRG